MRIPYHPQRCLFDQFSTHALGRELSVISTLIDEHPEIYQLAADDLIRVNINATGRQGLTVENIVRAAILKQYRQLSYHELAFYLEDSQSFRAFTRLQGAAPKKSVLQKTISAIKASTWEKINRVLLQTASKERIETGKVVRIDSTATETDIHWPSDSTLLCDAVRLILRLLSSAQSFMTDTKIVYCNRRKRVKRLALSILKAKERKRKKLYRTLLKLVEEELSYLFQAERALLRSNVGTSAVLAWLVSVDALIPLVRKVMEQAKRRVFLGEKVPASEKIMSLFETHTDIIAKGNREIVFGHKLNLTTGRSGLILDALIKRGNPSDSEHFIPMIERQREIYGVVPDRTAADGGYASKENVLKAKALGVEEVMFHKKRGLAIEEMVKSKWLYYQLRNFRAGIEGNISCLKRAYGLSRCLWKGWKHFQSYVWSSIVSYNLVVMARLKLKPT